jgi:adenylate cyclase class 2
LKIQAADLNTAKEMELEISDQKIMHQILQTIGFDAKVSLKKYRTETKYKNYTICIDEVERLGDFIEIEKLAEEAKTEEEYAAMWQILEELGIKNQNLEEKKYFEMSQELDE